MLMFAQRNEFLLFLAHHNKRQDLPPELDGKKYFDFSKTAVFLAFTVKHFDENSTRRVWNLVSYRQLFIQLFVSVVALS